MIYLENKYTKIYFNIIDRAKSRVIDEYTEKHHIIPKSLGGENCKENIVKLTAREHFICHWLLTKMVNDGKEKWKMLFAFHAFIMKNSSQYRLTITSKKYEILKRAASEARKNFNKGNKYALGYKQSKETRQKRNESLKYYKRPESANLKQSNTMKEKYKNKSHPLKGKSWEETFGVDKANEMKNKLKGKKGTRTKPTKKHDIIICPHCCKFGGSGNMKRYHFDNCLFQKSDVLSQS